MDANPFVVGAVAVVVLAQVPLVLYLSRYVELDADADRPDPREGYVTYGTREACPASNQQPTVDEDGMVACAHCGTSVDAGFEFCGACAGRVRGSASPHGGSYSGRWSE